MIYSNFYNTKSVVDYYINKYKNQIIVAVDMTTGNGNDLYSIANTINRESKLYGFDISQEAIKYTRDKLKDLCNKNIELILDNHKNIDLYVKEKIDLTVYNLGFLPGGSKEITTEYKTVLESLEKIFKLLNYGGIVIITFYPGHKSGLEESEKIEEYLSKLNQKEYNILKYNFINQINNPPYVVVIERGRLE